MNLVNTLISLLILIFIAGIFVFYLKSSYFKEKQIKLPEPNFDGTTSVEKAIKSRRSVRSYKQDSLNLKQISQLLWAAQGVTGGESYRSAPSAGALYPLEIYLIAGMVTDLDAGIYKYSNKNHTLNKICQGDKRKELSDAALSQECIHQAPASIVIFGIYEKTSGKYGERATRYVHMEAGCVAQNVYLQAGALGLGTVMVGAFDDAKIDEVLNLNKNEHTLIILPIGIINENS